MAQSKKFELDMCVVLVIDSMCVVQYVSQMKVDIIFRFWLYIYAEYDYKAYIALLPFSFHDNLMNRFRDI